VKQHHSNVCIVDDDADIREVMAGILSLEGYGVLLAADGESALEVLRARGGACCLILLDLMMPRMNGWEFRSRQMKDRDLESIPIVVLTGSGEGGRAAEEMEVAGWIQKPVDLDVLLQVVARFCG
jgi:CheY-like chemotaxis protein